jgi:hypothetical protein
MLPGLLVRSAGHARKFCNWNGTGSISPGTTCQLCQQEGHTARQCSKFYVNRQSTNNLTRAVPTITTDLLFASFTVSVLHEFIPDLHEFGTVRYNSSDIILIELPESNKAAICNLFNLTGKYTNLEFSEP